MEGPSSATMFVMGLKPNKSNTRRQRQQTQGSTPSFPMSMNQKKVSDYKTLGLKIGASQNEIRQAYRKLVLKEHPNKGGDIEKFKKIQAAYEELTKKAGGRRKTRRSYKRKGTRKMRR
jgi:DnaJ-class molecular chaperone